MPGRADVRCAYWDSKRRKLRTKSQLVEFDQCLNDDDKQNACADAAEALQKYFDANHNVEDNMPKDVDSCDSTDSSQPARKKKRRCQSLD